MKFVFDRIWNIGKWGGEKIPFSSIFSSLKHEVLRVTYWDCAVCCAVYVIRRELYILCTLEKHFQSDIHKTRSEFLPQWNLQIRYLKLRRVWKWVCLVKSRLPGQKKHQPPPPPPKKKKKKKNLVCSKAHMFSPLLMKLKMFASIKSRTSLTIGHVGSKTRSLGHIVEKPFVCYSWNMVKMFAWMKSWRILKMGHVCSKTRSQGQFLRNIYVCSRGHISVWHSWTLARMFDIMKSWVLPCHVGIKKLWHLV